MPKNFFSTLPHDIIQNEILSKCQINDLFKIRLTSKANYQHANATWEQQKRTLKTTIDPYINTSILLYNEFQFFIVGKKGNEQVGLHQNHAQ